jgi:antitoxin component YwqK of YwqJK toxin-antitoxin module
MATEEGHHSRVPLEQLDFDDEQNYLYEGIPFTGVAYEGESDEEGRTETTYADGVQAGLSREWYPSGSLKVQETFDRGVLHGEQRMFREDGSVAAVRQFELGILVRSVDLDELGAVAVRFELDENSPNYRLLQKLRSRRE